MTNPIISVTSTKRRKTEEIHNHSKNDVIQHVNDDVPIITQKGMADFWLGLLCVIKKQKQNELQRDSQGNRYVDLLPSGHNLVFLFSFLKKEDVVIAMIDIILYKDLIISGNYRFENQSQDYSFSTLQMGEDKIG